MHREIDFQPNSCIWRDTKDFPQSGNPVQFVDDFGYDFGRDGSDIFDRRVGFEMGGASMVLAKDKWGIWLSYAYGLQVQWGLPYKVFQQVLSNIPSSVRLLFTQLSYGIVTKIPKLS